MEDKIPYDELVYIKTEILDPIRDTLPTDKADAVFKAYQRLFPEDKQPRPCTCSSASKYWGDFIKRSKEKVEILLQEYLDTQKKDVNVTSSKKGRKKAE
jgi:hypothetical protein